MKNKFLKRTFLIFLCLVLGPCGKPCFAMGREALGGTDPYITELYGKASDEYFITVGLYYGKTELSDALLESSEGFIIATHGPWGFEETEDLRSFNKLRITADFGEIILSDMEGNIIKEGLSREEAVLSAAEEPDERIVSINGIAYRDGLIAGAAAEKSVFTLASYVSLEHYLWGVIPSEIGYRYPEEAVKAQAVAARSFALANLGRHKGGVLDFDLCSSTHCQAYGGVSKENESLSRAVESSAGEVAVYVGSDPGYRGKVISAKYFAYGSGYSMNSEDMWTKAVPYLREVRDEYTGEHRWNTEFTFDEISERLEEAGIEIGKLRSVRVGERLKNGAVQKLVFKGSSGTATVEKGRIMTIFNLKSLWFSLLSNGNRDESLPAWCYVKSGEGPYSISLVSASGSAKAFGNITLLSANGFAERDIRDIHMLSFSKANGEAEELSENADSSEEKYGFVSEICEDGMAYLSGIGFGHGVGMCQSGASNMAEAGFDYIDILRYYYTDVEIIDMKEAGF